MTFPTSFRTQWPSRRALGNSVGPVHRALQYAFYDWTREMPRSKRFITIAGLWIQGYAIYALCMRSLVWPVMWPRGPLLYASAWLLCLLGYCIINGMLTSEFVRKTQLEADQIAAQEIQRTLQPEKLERLLGYDMETFYKPLRAVGGDYFDLIELPNNRTLFAVADVSGKGMPAALLAANIQALVRSLAHAEANPLAMVNRINEHLSRYSPSEWFATAVFIVLNRNSGELTYVNAGHNAPMMFCSGSTAYLEATGLPLGLFIDAEYESRNVVFQPGDTLLVFTDGLIDSIPGENPQGSLRDALAGNPGKTMSNLKGLVDPKLSSDDITILLVKRAGLASTDGLA